MSSSIYTCAASMCCCLVVCSIIRIITPSGNTTRIMSVVISVFVLCCLLSPITELIKNFKIKSYEETITAQEYDFSSEIDKKVISQTADYLNEYVNLTLESAGVNNASIETILALSEQKGIYIREMNIYLDVNEKDKTEDIKELVLNSVGIEPNVLECVYG